MSAESVWVVFAWAMVTALATGLGALPFVFVRDFPKRWLGLANAAAAGLMLAASFNLIYEGLDYGMPRVALGLVVGLLFILVTRRHLAQTDTANGLALTSATGLKALMIVGVMTLHSFAEGVGVGVSFGDGATFGALISAAIALHNVPEGLAISLVLVPQGQSVARAAGWSIVSSLPQPLMAVPAFLFVDTFRQILPIGLGFAAGAMIWMAFSEILPDALADASAESVATVVTLSVTAMMVFMVLLG